MKFLSWLTTFLIIALIIAAFTAPGDKQFADFISKDKDGDTMTCKPIIGKTSYAKILFVKLFSFHNVNYCEKKKHQAENLESGWRQRMKEATVWPWLLEKFQFPK